MKKLLIILFSMLLLPVFAENTSILPSETGIVQDIQYVDINDDSLTQTKQNVLVKIKTGKFKGEIIELNNMLTGNPYYDIKLKRGTKVLLHSEDNGSGVEFSIEDIKRSGNLIWISLIFCGLLIYVGKKKGFYSLISIGITVLLITHFLCPLILMGINPVFAAMIVCILSTASTMYLVGGFNQKSTSATLGAMLSIIFACILSFIAVNAAHLTGFTGENSMYLYASHPELDFVSIIITTMILATLGAVMDVAMSIASTINELYETDKTQTAKDLFRSGMNVGRDIIGTMANTLILVYMGGALPLLLLSNSIDLQKFINLNQVVTEIASAIIGSIAIVICVPFTALVASQRVKRGNKQEQES